MLRLIFGLWLLILAVAVINGAFGDLVVAKWIGTYGVHVYKTLVSLIAVVIFSEIYAQRLRSSRWIQDVLECGVIWVMLTLGFEFIFGHYVLNHSWHNLLYDYNLSEGRLWSLVICFQLLAPFVIGWQKRGFNFDKGGLS